jgi:broad specificity phosphatase PhoE
MGDLVRYLTHPQVTVDPMIPVPCWGLSPLGKARANAVGCASYLAKTNQIISSGERKAIETAELIGGTLGVSMQVRQEMHENDRSATGFLDPNEFEIVTNRFFAEPLVSVRGWERAIDAQSRIVRETEKALAESRPGDVLFVGHGAVGTLLFCYYSGHPIDRTYDQRTGGGYYFAFNKEGRRILHPWRRMEHL